MPQIAQSATTTALYSPECLRYCRLSVMTKDDMPDSGNSADSPIAPVERAIVLALTLPFELGARVLASAPPSIEKARQQIVLARFVGKLAVDRGAREVRQRLEGGPEALEAESLAKVPEPTSEALATEDDVDTSSCDEGAASVDQESLALPDYDHLPAAHVVAKLPGLSQAERDTIENYEMNGRHRRTILGKLALLRLDEDGE
jgi:hypothetical protein